MSRSMYKLQFLQGAFIILVGVLGYYWNPEKARSALISGSLFGGINILWGLIMFQGGHKWVNSASLIINLVFSLVLSWRAFSAWSAYLNGAVEKLVPASLISLMLFAALVMVFILRSGNASGKSKAAKSK